jgi:hypothetical protein
VSCGSRWSTTSSTLACGFGMSSRATIETTAQPTMYQEIPVDDPVRAKMAVAISGAGPPATTDASW